MYAHKQETIMSKILTLIIVILNSDKVNVTVYAPPSQLNVTGDSCIGSTLVLDNSISDLNPETITWYRTTALLKVLIIKVLLWQVAMGQEAD